MHRHTVEARRACRGSRCRCSCANCTVLVLALALVPACAAGGNPANALTVAVTDKAAVVALHQALKDEKPVDGMLQKTNLAATKVRDYLKSNGY